MENKGLLNELEFPRILPGEPPAEIRVPSGREGAIESTDTLSILSTNA
jgi:hypothetical protein